MLNRVALSVEGLATVVGRQDAAERIVEEALRARCRLGGDPGPPRLPSARDSTLQRHTRPLGLRLEQCRATVSRRFHAAYSSNFRVLDSSRCGAGLQVDSQRLETPLSLTSPLRLEWNLMFYPARKSPAPGLLRCWCRPRLGADHGLDRGLAVAFFR